ncbi:high mobility group protein HMGI-C-like [Rhinatrema bivittatum]|uniref:high mobility group protein HMGI-C-like n=1 Tax=Rhinatrema bivittatum TaxID=194408 RepID=UPI00112B5D16|nr:high mobility group protein HMGI-C-like [Rhinatrema bivittatum]
MSSHKETVAMQSPSSQEASPLPQPQKRGRGRPRKQQQDPIGPPPQKRPRGRPRESKVKEVLKAQHSAEKRPRGRPRKWPKHVVEKETSQEQPGEDVESLQSRPQKMIKSTNSKMLPH